MGCSLRKTLWLPLGEAGYRLPTEAEWELAARAGSTTALYNGDLTEVGCNPLDSNLDQIGWYCANSNAAPQSLRTKAPNANNLYDMAGNVFEWVWDWYDENYYTTTQPVDPDGPMTGTEKVFRGGAWNLDAAYCRSASRANNGPEKQFGNLGFRLARTLPVTDDDDDIVDDDDDVTDDDDDDDIIDDDDDVADDDDDTTDDDDRDDDDDNLEDVGSGSDGGSSGCCG